MPAVFSLVLILAAAALIWQLARRAERRRKSAPAPPGIWNTAPTCLSTAAWTRWPKPARRTCSPIPAPARRTAPFFLHLTLHNATNQPIDTVFTLRMDAGRQTVITLHFLREAFGYREPVFPQELMDSFMAQKLGAHRVC